MSDSVLATYSGSLTADVLTVGKIPEPDALYIFMTRGNGANEFRRRHGSIRRLVIDVDGERHDFSADALIRLLEGLEVDDERDR